MFERNTIKFLEKVGYFHGTPQSWSICHAHGSKWFWHEITFLNKSFNAKSNGGIFVHIACKEAKQHSRKRINFRWNPPTDASTPLLIHTHVSSHAQGSNFEIMTQFVDLCRTKKVSNKTNFFLIIFTNIACCVTEVYYFACSSLCSSTPTYFYE